MGKFSRDKGKRGEREVVNILRDELGSDLEIGRNHAQCDKGGSDIAGNLPYSIEVKNHDKTSVGLWWQQACKQATPGKAPVLIYKVPYKGWRVVLELDLFSVFPTDNNDTVEMDIYTFCNLTREFIANAVMVDDNRPSLHLDS